MDETVIVTRFNLVGPLLKEMKIVPEETPVMATVTENDIKGKIVYGHIPNHLLGFPKRMVFTKFRIPKDVRPETTEELKQYFTKMYEYEIKLVREIDVT